MISPSGALFYDGSVFPWRGSLVLGGLSSRALIRLTLDGAKVTGEERIDMQRRIRDVIQARDGALLVITDNQKGELLPVPRRRQPVDNGGAESREWRCGTAVPGVGRRPRHPHGRARRSTMAP